MAWRGIIFLRAELQMQDPCDLGKPPVTYLVAQLAPAKNTQVRSQYLTMSAPTKRVRNKSRGDGGAEKSEMSEKPTKVGKATRANRESPASPPLPPENQMVATATSTEKVERPTKVSKATKATKEGTDPPAPSENQMVTSTSDGPGADAATGAATSMERRPFAKLLLDAINTSQHLMLPRGDPLVDIARVPISSPAHVEASPGSLLPPILELPGIVVTAPVTFRHICLRLNRIGDLVAQWYPLPFFWVLGSLIK